MNISSSTPASSLTLREWFVYWRMRDGACETASCDPAVISCFRRSCLLPATGVLSDSQEDANNSQRAAAAHGRPVFPRMLLHLLRAAQRRMLPRSSGAMAGGKMNLSHVMPPGSFLTPPSLPSFQSPAIF